MARRNTPSQRNSFISKKLKRINIWYKIGEQIDLKHEIKNENCIKFARNKTFANANVDPFVYVAHVLDRILIAYDANCPLTDCILVEKT